MDSAHQKMYRARDHYVELREKLIAYYTGSPGEFFEGPDSNATNPMILFREREPLPKRFGLMFGDCIQCLRSSLDYLVFELVEVASKPHHTQNQFPIATSPKAYRDKLRSHYLDGISPKAEAMIKSLQPFHAPDPRKHPLTILDKLANINKHHRVILTNFVSTSIAPSTPLKFPHIRGVVRTVSIFTEEVVDVPVWAYVAIKDELMQNQEMITGIETLSEFVISKVFPLFETFFT